MYQFRFFYSSFRLILFLAVIGLVNACSTVRVADESTAAFAGGPAIVTGYVVETDGATPVYGATVAVLADEPTDGQATGEVSRKNCASPEQPHVSYTCTREDGSFSVDLTGVHRFPVNLKIQDANGTRELTITEKSVNSDIGAIVLSQSAAEGKDKVAVVMDFYNPIEEIREFLDDSPSQLQNVKLQLINEYQNLYQISSDHQEVSYPTFYSLFVDKDDDGEPDILNYDVVYINSRDQSDIAQLDASIRRKLLQFINSGGRLYVTEWTVEMEQLEESGPEQYI